MLGTSFGQADKSKKKADNIAEGWTRLRGWLCFSFCPQQRKSHKVSGGTTVVKLKGNKACLGFSSLRVVFIFSFKHL